MSDEELWSLYMSLYFQALLVLQEILTVIIGSPVSKFSLALQIGRCLVGLQYLLRGAMFRSSTQEASRLFGPDLDLWAVMSTSAARILKVWSWWHLVGAYLLSCKFEKRRWFRHISDIGIGQPSKVHSSYVYMGMGQYLSIYPFSVPAIFMFIRGTGCGRISISCQQAPQIWLPPQAIGCQSRMTRLWRIRLGLLR